VFGRAVCLVILDVHVWAEPGALWQPGPLPVAGPADGTVSDRAARGTYFHERVARALHGDGRYWRPLTPDLPAVPDGLGFEATDVELLRYRTGHPNAYLVVHGRLTAQGADIVNDLWGLAQQQLANSPLREWCDAVLAGIGHHAAASMFATTVTFVTPDEAPLDGVLARADRSLWTPTDQWLWLLASRLEEDRYAPTASDHAAARESTIELSLDWSAQVRRAGVGFLGLRPDAGASDRPYGNAERFVRSMYPDVVLLGLIQRSFLLAFADALAILGDPVANPDDLRRLETQFRRFRNVYWWQQVTSQEYGNLLLRIFADRNHLPELHAQIVDELGEYSRQVQTAAAERTNALVALATPVLPFAIMIGVDQVLHVQRLSSELAGLAAAVVVSAVLLLSPAGRRSFQPLLPDRFRDQAAGEDDPCD
jgi:hypothetical protein